MKMRVIIKGEVLARGAEMLDDLAEFRRSRYERLENSLEEGPIRTEYERMKKDIIARNKETWRKTSYLPPILKGIVRGSIKNKRSAPLLEYLEEHGSRQVLSELEK